MDHQLGLGPLARRPLDHDPLGGPSRTATSRRSGTRLPGRIAWQAASTRVRRRAVVAGEVDDAGPGPVLPEAEEEADVRARGSRRSTGPDRRWRRGWPQAVPAGGSGRTGGGRRPGTRRWRSSGSAAGRGRRGPAVPRSRARGLQEEVVEIEERAALQGRLVEAVRSVSSGAISGRGRDAPAGSGARPISSRRRSALARERSKSSRTISVRSIGRGDPEPGASPAAGLLAQQRQSQAMEGGDENPPRASGRRAASRSSISAAARRLKVTARHCSGGTPAR